MSRPWAGALALAGLLLSVSPSVLALEVSSQATLPAAYSVSPGLDWHLSYGVGSRAGIRKLGVVAGWQRNAPLWQGEQWRLALRHELEVAFWRVPKAKNIIEAGYSPFLRLERPLSGSRQFFVEASIGVRLLSHTRLSSEHTLSTAFQFSDQLGVGYQWGPQGRSTLGLRFQHLSNAGIKRPNPGINFTQIYYRHQF